MKLKYCPYCLEKLKDADLCYVCTKNETENVYIPYEEWNTYRRQGALPLCPGGSTKKTFHASGCASCNGGSLHMRSCKHCHHDISASMIDRESLLYSIIGTSNAGKTLYMTMLFETLINELPEISNMSYVAINNETSRRQVEAISELNKSRLPSNTTNADAKKPLIYRLGNTNSKPHLLTFFDGAGETFQDGEVSAIHQRYINYSDGIVLLFDPLTLPEVQLKLKLPRGGTATPETGLLNVCAQYVNWNAPAGRISRHVYNIVNARRKIDIPVAVVFSKLDKLWEYFDENSAIRNTGSPHFSRGAFVESDSLRVDEEVRTWLGDWGARNFLSLVAERFSNVRYFAVSSLGQDPLKTGTMMKYAPIRVADPILWMMSRRKLIPVIK